MSLLRLLLYTALGLVAACASVTQIQPSLTPSPAPTATTDWSTQMQLTFSGTGDYATPPFEAIEVTTSDGEPVTMDITLIYYIAPVLIRNADLDKWDDYLKNGVIPAVRETIGEVIGQFTAREIYNEKRVEMQDILKAELETNLSKYGVILQDSLVRDVAFTREFNTKVELEIVATQYASLTAEAQLQTPTP